jgi:hypothetical protein
VLLVADMVTAVVVLLAPAEQLLLACLVPEVVVLVELERLLASQE